jgi:hypothetical protein
VPEQPPPDHPWNTDPGDAAAVRVTLELVVKLPVHVAPQLIPAGEEVTVPVPVPVRFTVRLKVPSANVAVTFLAALIVTTHCPVPEQPSPDQPWKVMPVPAFAVSVTVVPSLKVALQVAPQLMPVGTEVTVPVPAPALVTVSVCVMRVNVAVTVVALLIVTLQGSVPTQLAPDHPVKEEPADGVAVRSTLEPTLKFEEQVAPQLMLPGVPADVTVPLPVPFLETVSVAVVTTKLAVAVAAVFSVNVHVAAEFPPAHETPLHPEKVDADEVGAAVRVTLDPTGKLALHVAPQLIPAGVEVTVPKPAPVFETVSTRVSIAKVAVTVVAALMGTVHCRLLPEQPPPDHDENTDPACGAAVSVTEVPAWKLALHVAPQLMPAGDEVTVPAPAPVFETVRVRMSITKVAVTLVGLLGTVITHWPLPEHPPPDHDWNTHPVGALALSVTLEATLKVLAHVAPQSMPAGEEVTVPVPTLLTEMVLSCCVNVAVTDCAPPPGGMAMVQLPMPLQPAPLQPVNVEPGLAVALIVTEVPLA